MWFLGYGFNGTAMSLAPTPTDISDIGSVTLRHGYYDKIYISRKAAEETVTEIPSSWDFDTILYADFDDNTNAGNVNFNTDDVNELLIKRRFLDESNQWSKWMTICVKHVETEEDMYIDDVDLYNAGMTTYQYAIVPVKDNIEGQYYSTIVRSEFNGIYLAEKGQIWGSPISNQNIDTTRNISKTFNVLMNNRYPVPTSNTTTNYDTGSVSANFLPVEDDGCTLITDDLYRIPYQKAFMDFLTNYQPKILKVGDGRIWLCDINPSPTDTAVDVYNNRDIAFEFTEIGNYLSEKDLYYCNLSDISEVWWS